MANPTPQDARAALNFQLALDKLTLAAVAMLPATLQDSVTAANTASAAIADVDKKAWCWDASVASRQSQAPVSAPRS
jgi:type II secretory pathway pseudopilin PulG